MYAKELSPTTNVNNNKYQFWSIISLHAEVPLQVCAEVFFIGNVLLNVILVERQILSKHWHIPNLMSDKIRFQLKTKMAVYLW